MVGKTYVIGYYSTSYIEFIEISFNKLFFYEKKRCWACGFQETIKWSKRKGKQRYKCINCGIFFTEKNEGVRRKNLLVWFEKWVIERLTYRYLKKDSGYSQSTLQRMFKSYLLTPPIFPIRRSNKAHLIIDGTYFSNDLCLVLYWDNDVRYIQMYRFSNGEKYEQISEDLRNLHRLGIEVVSVTCDGKKGIIKAVNEVYPLALIQRCIVHIHRQSLLFLRKKPKTEAAVELIPIARMLCAVKNHNDRIFWIEMFHRWHLKHMDFINEKNRNEESGRWWYRHKNLRRATMLISNAIPNLFHFLDNPEIPNSTNALESFFGHLKDSLSIHRGLSYQNRKAFIQWYLYFKNTNRT